MTALGTPNDDTQQDPFGYGLFYTALRIGLYAASRSHLSTCTIKPREATIRARGKRRGSARRVESESSGGIRSIVVPGSLATLIKYGTV